MKKIARILLTLALACALWTAVGFEANARGGGGHGGGRSHSHSGHSRCVGVCYGATSAKTGLPRNTYVRGYVKKDGTVVQPYTRSR